MISFLLSYSRLDKYKFLESEWTLMQSKLQNYTFELHYLTSAQEYGFTLWKDSIMTGSKVVQLDDSLIYAGKFNVDSISCNGTYIQPKIPDVIQQFSSTINDKDNGNYHIEIKLEDSLTITVEILEDTHAKIVMMKHGSIKIAEFNALVDSISSSRLKISKNLLIYIALIAFIVVQIANTCCNCVGFFNNNYKKLSSLKQAVKEAKKEVDEEYDDEEEQNDEEEEIPQKKNTDKKDSVKKRTHK